MRRAVWARDRGSCAFLAVNGQRCGETGGLEFHHKVPFAEGGEATEMNTELRCKVHNLLEASRWFGEEVTGYRERPRPNRPTGEFDQPSAKGETGASPLRTP